jgi:hypothetical protein
LLSARATLRELGGEDGALLAGMLDAAIAETRAIVADLVRSPDQMGAVAERLRRIEGQVAALSDALGRRYFTLLPVIWAESLLV